MHPGTLLTSLVSAAAVTGIWCWSQYETGRLRRGPEAGSGRQAGSEASVSGATATVEAHALLQRQAAGLESRVGELEKENRELREKLAAALEASKPPPDPGTVANRIAGLRELEFRKLPEWVPTAPDEIVKQLTGARRASIDEGKAALRVRAWRAMGFVPDQFDFRDAAASLAAMKPYGFWDAETGRFHYQKDASLQRADSREQFAGALLPVLLAQNFPPAAQSWEATDNDDAARAALSLIYGDANFTRVRFSISDQMNTNYDKGQAPPAPPPSYNAPQFMGETWKWTEDQGNLFVQTLHGSGGLAAVNAAYQRLPQSTAEILHPDTLYLANPPFRPDEVELDRAPVRGKAPYFSNVAGELACYFLLRPWADVDFSTAASEGWKGDRYLVYPGADGRGDHVLWRSQWMTGKDAEEFHAALRRILMQRYSIPWQPEYDISAERFAVNEPGRAIRIVRQGAAVTLIDATDGSFAEALAAAFLPAQQ
jgi:hypothetical protein